MGVLDSCISDFDSTIKTTTEECGSRSKVECVIYSRPAEAAKIGNRMHSKNAATFAADSDAIVDENLL